MTSMYNTVCFNIHTLPCVKNAVGKATFTGSKRMDCSSYFQMQAKACQEKTGVKQIMVHLLAWFKKISQIHGNLATGMSKISNFYM